jgi:hypothetical protein
MLSVYAKSNIDIETVVGAMPPKYQIYIVEKWTEERHYEVESRQKDKNSKPKKIAKKSISYHGLLLISKDSIDPLRTYVSLKINKNYYPRHFEDEKSLYAQLKPQEKKEADRLFGATAAILNEKAPKYGYGFYQFETSRFVPVIFGMLWTYPGFETTQLNYALKQNHQ